MHRTRPYPAAPFVRRRPRKFAAVVAVTALVLTAGLFTVGTVAVHPTHLGATVPAAPSHTVSTGGMDTMIHATPAVQLPYGVRVVSAGATFAGLLPWFGSGPCQDPSSGTSPTNPALVSGSMSGLCLNGVNHGEISSTWTSNLTNATSYANGSSPVVGCPPLSLNVTSYPGCVFFGSNELTAFVSNWSSGAPVNSSVFWHPNETGWLPDDRVFQVDVGFNVSAPLGTTYSLTIDFPGATPVPQTFFVRSPLVMGGGSVDVAFDTSLAWTTLLPWNNTTRVGVLSTVDSYALNMSLVSPCSVCYNVSFNATGLPGGNTWFVELGTPAQVSDNTTIGSFSMATYGQVTFSEPNGTYRFGVADSSCSLAGAPSAGTVVVNGSGVLVLVQFHLASCVPVLFKSTGLGPGLVWGITILWPAAMAGTATVGSNGSNPIAFELANGTVDFAVSAPPGYAVSRVSGPGVPSFSTANVSGPTKIVIHFGALENVTFSGRDASRLPGLPPVGKWSVTLTPRGPGADPSVLTSWTAGSSVTFVLPHGARYNFSIEVDSGIFFAGPSYGSLGVPGHGLLRAVLFHPVTEKVVFVNLVQGTPAPTLCVNVVGPMNLSSCTTRHSIVFHLVNGSYNFTDYETPGPPLSPASGTFVANSSALVHYVVLQYVLLLPVAGGDPSQFVAPAVVSQVRAD